MQFITGANNSGKPRLFMRYSGRGRYRRIREEIVAEGYKGFRFQAKSAALGRRRVIQARIVKENKSRDRIEQIVATINLLRT